MLPIIADDEAQLLALLRGDIHVLPGRVDPADLACLEAEPNVDVTVSPGFHMFYLAFNMRQDPLDDIVVRRALAHVIDRDEIIFSLFQGYMLPLAEFVPPVLAVLQPGHGRGGVRSRAGRADSRRRRLRHGAQRHPHQPATGEELRPLEHADAHGGRAPTSAELGVIIAEAAQAIGLPVVATPMDFNVIVDRISNETEDGGRDFDMYVLAWSLSRFPTHLYSLFHSDFDVDGGNNNPGMRDPQYDAAAERVCRPRDLDEAFEAAYEAQEIIQWVQPYIPLYSRPYIRRVPLGHRDGLRAAPGLRRRQQRRAPASGRP